MKAIVNQNINPEKVYAIESEQIVDGQGKVLKPEVEGWSFVAGKELRSEF
jgi:hypothetical protein